MRRVPNLLDKNRIDIAFVDSMITEAEAAITEAYQRQFESLVGKLSVSKESQDVEYQLTGSVITMVLPRIMIFFEWISAK